MRRKMQIISLIILCCCLVTIIISSIISYHNQNKFQDQINDSISMFDIIDGTNKDTCYVISQSMPEFVSDTLNSSGWKVQVDTTNAENFETIYGYVVGTVNYDEQKIIVHPDRIEDSLYHEFGHMLDKDYCYSDSEVFSDIYKKESLMAQFDSFQESLTAKNNIHEYFACSVRMYCLSPNTMLEYQPETYDFINSIVKENHHD